MKLNDLIKKLQKIEERYRSKHGVSPTIWGWDSDGIELCAKRKKISAGTTKALKPYMKIKTKLPGL